MRSLGDHLMRAGEHGALPFHPDCPLCRAERLGGPLPADELLPGRARAGILAGVIAVSAAAGPAAALPGVARASAEPPPETIVEEDDLEGEELPEEELNLTPEEEAALDTELGAGPDEAVPEMPEEPIPVEEAPAPEAEAAPTPVQPPGSPAPPPPPPTPPTPVPPAPPATERTDEEAGERRGGEDRAKKAPELPAPAPAPPPPAPVQDAPAPAQQPPGDATPSAQPPSSEPAPHSSARTYVVEPGDSLWAIAEALLGPDATPAQVAREVDRLWRLNADRIDTGSPSLILPGQRLVLE